MTNIAGSKKLLLNSGYILFFILTAYIYLGPLFEGKRLSTFDLEQHEGMAREINNFRDKTGKEPLWTNSMFCGMPAYMISTRYPGNLVDSLHNRFTDFLYPASMFILYFIGFFILLSSLKINKWLAVAGALALGFSSYLVIIIGAGHTSKAYAIGYLAVVVAGLLMTFRDKQITGAIIFTLALAFEIAANHLQISYYGFIFIAIFLATELVFAIKENRISQFVKSSLLILAGAVIAIAINYSKLATVSEYSKRTIRGPSELTGDPQNKTAGLDKDNILKWSQGIDETLTLLIPNFKGGSQDEHPGLQSESYKAMQKNGLPDAKQKLQSVILYHGEKPMTSGPFYAGAIIIFLFVLSLFILKGPLKWWLLISVIVSVLLSWGKNVMILTDFLFKYLPLYSKFRSPDTILVITGFSVALSAFLALNDVISGKVSKENFFHGLKMAFYITGGITLLFTLIPSVGGNFSAPFDEGYPAWLLDGIKSDRKNLLRADAFRSLVLIILSAGVLFAWYKDKIKQTPMIIILGLLMVADLWIVDKRYLNDRNFVPKKEKNDFFRMTVADNEILKDKNPDYRVLPLQNPFNNTKFSYYHKNILGYHAAKLRRTHELIDKYLVPEMEDLVNTLKKQQQPFSMPPGYKFVNMLNARYVIYDVNFVPLLNKYAMGNAWFAGNYRIMKNADEEFASLKEFDPIKEVLVDKKYSEFINGKSFIKDTSGVIELVECQPDNLKYKYKASSEQLTVFSEIYYDKGWDAFIDGVKVPHFRVNYIYRGIVIPEGLHAIEFRFHPASYYTGEKISLASSVLLILIIAGFGFIYLKKLKVAKVQAEMKKPDPLKGLPKKNAKKGK